MTSPKPIAADIHFPYDSSMDNSSQMNAHQNAPFDAGARIGEMAAEGQRSDPFCETRFAKDHLAKQMPIKEDDIRLLSHPRSETPDPMQYEGQDSALVSLEAFLKPQELKRICISSSSLHHLWSANLDPPVTKASLSELDIERFSLDPRLRHNVSIDRRVCFRPNIHKKVVEQKLARAAEYWNALVLEFAIYITRSRMQRGVIPTMESPWLSGLSTVHLAPFRVLRMLHVIKEVSKSLISDTEWITIDLGLDEDLLLQELEKGVCDVHALIAWLGSLLKGSCSPMRDHEVDAMMSKVQKGAEAEDARVIVQGLADLFGVLETMKLDVANHQLRVLQLYMMDDFVPFQQKYFMRRIQHEQDLKSAHMWFEAPDMINQITDHQTPTTQLDVFLLGLVELITDQSKQFPHPFEFDFDRLGRVQKDYRYYRNLSAYQGIFNVGLRQLGWSTPPSMETYDSLSSRISALAASRNLDFDSPKIIKPVALEIARQVQKVRGDSNLPSDHLLRATEESLRNAQDPISWSSLAFDFRLCDDLGKLILKEAIQAKNMTPLQLRDRFNPPTPIPRAVDELNSLPRIAKRIAHIGLLHWLVWGPILYRSPWRASHQGQTIRQPGDTAVDAVPGSRTIFESVADDRSDRRPTNSPAARS